MALEVRERALVLFYRCTVGTSEEPDDFADVCRLFKSTNCPEATVPRPRFSGEMVRTWLRGRLGTPRATSAASSCSLSALGQVLRDLFIRKEAIRLVIGKLQTGDIYEAWCVPLLAVETLRRAATIRSRSIDLMACPRKQVFCAYSEFEFMYVCAQVCLSFLRGNYPRVRFCGHLSLNVIYLVAEAMREIVDRYFGDSWVTAYALGL